MGDSLLSSITEAKYIEPTDLIYSSVDPSGTPADRKFTAARITAGAYVVTDTTLPDHADASTPGTIAYALAQVASDGKGKVLFGPGTFDVTSGTITVSDNVMLEGCGRGISIINQKNNAVDGVRITGTGTVQGTLANFNVNMPTTAASLTCAFKVKGAYGILQNLYAHGGSANSWGFIFDNFYNWTCSGLKVNPSTTLGVSNGVLMHNGDSNFNVGDSSITGLHMRLRGAAIGLHMQSDAGGSGTASVNDVHFLQMQILGTSSTETGIILDQAPRNSFMQCDIENVPTVMTTAAGAGNNTFINCSDFGGSTITNLGPNNKFLNGINKFGTLNNL